MRELATAWPPTTVGPAQRIASADIPVVRNIQEIEKELFSTVQQLQPVENLPPPSTAFNGTALRAASARSPYS